MTSNDAKRYHVIACLTRSATPPQLDAYFEERAAELVKELAIAVWTRRGQLTAATADTHLWEHLGITLDEPDATEYRVRLRDIVSRPGSDIGSTIRYLVDDYVLVERWIIQRKGLLYPVLLFGSHRTIPLIDAQQPTIAVKDYLENPLAAYQGPVDGLLVDSGTTLRIARAAGMSGNTTPGPANGIQRFRDILVEHREYYLWLQVFSM